MDPLDPAKIVESEQTIEMALKESLDEFERRIWPIYEARGYSKDTALISYSVGVLSDTVDDLLLELDGSE